MNEELLIQNLSMDEAAEEPTFILTLRIKCDYDVSVRSPKVAILFSEGKQDRRFPMSIDSYYPEADFKRAVIFASVRIRSNYLFMEPLSGGPIQMEFELIYGNQVIFPMAFKVRNDVHPVMEDFKATFDPEKNRILLDPIIRETVYADTLPLRILKQTVHWIHRLILVVLTIVLFPWFLLEAVLSLLGCASVSPNVKSFHGAKMRFLLHLKYSYQGLWHRKLNFTSIHQFMTLMYRVICFFCPVRKNRVTFFSSRRSDLTGNPQFVYEELKKDPNIEFRFLMNADAFFHLNLGNICKFLYLYATSSVVMVDDFFQLLNYVDKRPEVRLIQLWHACGAFKTFGFSRIGKPGGPRQNTYNHRQYDYSIVSSKEIAKFYAEGFGISQSHIAATGIPRTDIFMDSVYAEKVRTDLYAKYPILKEKKVLLFAPTFRGNGQKTAYYPLKRFNPVKVYEECNQEYVILLKLHPFCKEKFEIPSEYKDVILDFSAESELNDLLFVSDLLITDYSSAVFEASLLNVPMLLYAYDLREYISQRDFYYEYESFVPGKIALTEKAMLKAIREQDFETEKIEAFRNRFFDDLDGKSTQRVADLVRSLLNSH